MSNTSYIGPSFLSLLGILFVGLRLTGLIDWDWWLVLSPLIVETLLFLVGLVIGLLMIASDNRKWRR